ncbi:GNAT family N-acetyltransferase [Niabella drilacis]|uniref:Protein N-acetyltransferase, RimJ/RimL family n=1 Tax=Niabella drilacis (strain DSM 25811 / CCM 8410 / CCUG 62505 / LMG 26954 / E90) TaxID=1285928 RepID=A0A1G6Z3A8_NIADE|nr:GNAT family N-acetyltransferase [Niabella drilacis]SDD97149.1 Protein N-acetyltransferase, RimJ/RimL family [Niabella drilacis]
MSDLISLETERLLLRPTSEEDAPFLFYLMNSPKWLKYIGNREITSFEKARNYILLRIRPQQQLPGFGSFTVIRKSDQKKMGTCGLYRREGLPAPDIGFALLPRFEHKGYAFEAAQKLLETGFEAYHLEQVFAITMPGNSASQKLLKKLGLKPNGMFLLPGDETASCLFQLAHSAWASTRHPKLQLNSPEL